VLGAAILFDTDMPGFGVSWPVLGAIAAIVFLLSLAVAFLAFTSRRREVATGAEQMIGLSGKVENWDGTAGYVIAHGERWKAVSGEPLSSGDEISVTGRKGLTLEVIRRPQES
jgi:membrane-bound serine protease (ClpP class)